MPDATATVGQPTNRVDGPLKVTGGATYAAEYDAPDLLHGHVVSSTITRGRIVSIDDAAARAVPGVVEVFTHLRRPRTTRFRVKHKDQAGPPGRPFQPLHDEHIIHNGQPVALVVAETFEAARDAAALVRVTYETAPHTTDLDAVLDHAYHPPRNRLGVAAPPKPRGDADRAFAAAPVQVDATYHMAAEYHNPIELLATTVVWEGDDRITVYDKTQGSQSVQLYVRNVFGFKMKNVRVVNAFVGGAFGMVLRPQHSLFLAVMAAKALQRSVRVELTRAQMFTLTYRPDAVQRVRLGADRSGTLQALVHHAVAVTSPNEDYQETVVNWSGVLYRCDNVKLEYELATVDTATPGDMRAPGAATGSFAIESAMDELAHALGMDPVALRLVNYTERDDDQDKEFTSKALGECYSSGAERFGWARRSPEPRSMREERELVGWGMATGIWAARMAPVPTRARATLTPEGTIEVASSTADIGTGTYTILTQIAADAFGLPLAAVHARLGDSALPLSMVEGGSWTAASTGSAVHAACEKLKKEIVRRALRIDGSPLADARAEDVRFAGGMVELVGRPGVGVTLRDVVRAGGGDAIDEMGTVMSNPLTTRRYAGYTHSAIFAEVRVDEQLGVMRVTRVVSAIAAGRILNPKTAGSQIRGAVVMAIGQALHEEALTDHTLGRVMNHNLAEYHVPVNADIYEIDVIFVGEVERRVSPIGVKGVGEIGVVGTAAAIANAVFHATGRRVRSLPITLDQLL